jgi:hypothetical protein
MSSRFTVSPLIDTHGSFERTKILYFGGTVLGSLRHDGIAMPANGGTGLHGTL